MSETTVCETAEDTFALGETLGKRLSGGEMILLFGGLGAGKTLLTKGIMFGLGYDVDEVTSPSFSLVNLYQTPGFPVYHVDLWRLDPEQDPAAAVGLDDIVEDETAVTIIEWADRLSRIPHRSTMYRVNIEGDGHQPRVIAVERI